MATKKLAKNDVFRLARQKLIDDIAKAVGVYEQYITSGKAPKWTKRSHKGEERERE